MLSLSLSLVSGDHPGAGHPSMLFDVSSVGDLFPAVLLFFFLIGLVAMTLLLLHFSLPVGVSLETLYWRRVGLNASLTRPIVWDASTLLPFRVQQVFTALF